jgi:hypothetical protein
VKADCLICERADGGFSSVEHPIPESLGNTSIVLPAGVVCDRCNQGVLATLDEQLVAFPALMIRRTSLGVRTKAGKVPVTSFVNSRLIHNGQFAALVGEMSPRTWTETHRSRIDPRYSLGMATVSGGRRLTPQYCRKVARALIKVGFECAWLERAAELHGPIFDSVRAAILGTDPNHHGYLFVAGQIDERNTAISVDYTARRHNEEEITSLLVHANFYGVRMVTDSCVATPPPGLTPDLGFAITF